MARYLVTIETRLYYHVEIESAERPTLDAALELVEAQRPGWAFQTPSDSETEALDVEKT